MIDLEKGFRVGVEIVEAGQKRYLEQAMDQKYLKIFDSKKESFVLRLYT